MDVVTIVVGFVALALSTVAVILVFWKRLEKRDRDTEEIANQLRAIINEQTRSSTRPDLAILLGTQWDFIAKVVQNRIAKANICKHMVEKYIKDDSAVMLDSGSTTDLVTLELREQRRRGVHVSSNNLLAALHLAGATEVTFKLFPGQFDHRFAAVYSDDANIELMRQGFAVIILAAVRFRASTGIMVEPTDDANKKFKATALRKFREDKNSRLFVAVDPFKLVLPTKGFIGVLDQEEWEQVMKQNHDRITVCTTEPPSHMTADEELVALRKEIKVLRDNGITVDDFKA